MEKDENKLIEKINFTFDIFPNENKTNIASETKSAEKKEIVNYVGSNKVVLKKRLYIGFKTRVSVLVVSILILLLISIVSFSIVFFASKHYEVRYSETSEVNYLVCDGTDNCIKPNKNSFLSTNCSYLDTNFIYNVDISDSVSYDINYYIESEFVITDKNDSNIVLYRKNDKLLENKNIKKTDFNININERIKIDFNDYYNKVQNYILNNNVDVNSNIFVSLYVMDNKDTTKVSSIGFNILDKNVKPTIKKTSNLNQKVIIEKDAWTDTNKLLVIVCVFCGVIVLFLITRLSNLLLKTFYRKDRYTKEVNKILRTYDEDIVIARDGFNSLENKRVVKVSEFKELLDAKNILKKPIIYVRINEIKSKFIVEDVECIYEYTIKDLDF